MVKAANLVWMSSFVLFVMYCNWNWNRAWAVYEMVYFHLVYFHFVYCEETYIAYATTQRGYALQKDFFDLGPFHYSRPNLPNEMMNTSVTQPVGWYSETQHRKIKPEVWSNPFNRHNPSIPSVQSPHVCTLPIPAMWVSGRMECHPLWEVCHLCQLRFTIRTEWAMKAMMISWSIGRVIGMRMKKTEKKDAWPHVFFLKICKSDACDGLCLRVPSRSKKLDAGGWDDENDTQYTCKS